MKKHQCIVFEGTQGGLYVRIRQALRRIGRLQGFAIAAALALLVCLVPLQAKAQDHLPSRSPEGDRRALLTLTAYLGSYHFDRLTYTLASW